MGILERLRTSDAHRRNANSPAPALGSGELGRQHTLKLITNKNATINRQVIDVADAPREPSKFSGAKARSAPFRSHQNEVVCLGAGAIRLWSSPAGEVGTAGMQLRKAWRGIKSVGIPPGNSVIRTHQNLALIWRSVRKSIDGYDSSGLRYQFYSR